MPYIEVLNSDKHEDNEVMRYNVQDKRISTLAILEALKDQQLVRLVLIHLIRLLV